MTFDKNYYEAREAAVKWLRRNPDRRDYAEGIALLERMQFKPLLTHRLKQCANNPMMLRVLVQAVADGINVYRNPTSQKYADTIPAEVEEVTGGTLPPPPEEPSSVQSVAVSQQSPTIPETARRVSRWFADAYRRRDRLHREMRALGESNDPSTMARRKTLSDRINRLTDYMDELYPLKEAYDVRGVAPTEEQMADIGVYDVWEARQGSTEAQQSLPSAATVQDAASFRKKDEDFDSMSIEELRKRLSSIRTQLVRKQNQLLYQSDSKREKENPMPPCPERTKIETQVAALNQKLYLVIKAISKFG